MSKTDGKRPNQPIVLVVDDERGPRESLKIILQPTYHVIVAVNGPQALEMLEEHEPDVVLSDIRMPGMTGTQLLTEIKARSPETPVILITGYATVETAQQAIRGSAFDYVNKPYNVVDILKVVGQALSVSEKRRQKKRAIRQLEDWNQQLKEQIGHLDQKATVADLSAELIHDLNNPMTAMRGYLALLEHSLGRDAEGTLSHDQLEFLDILKEQVERCVQLTQSFLNFAKGVSDTVEQTDVTALIQDTLFVLRVRVMTQGIDLKTHFDPDVPPLWLMQTPLQQICYNLISNAADAIGEDSTEGQILISTELTVGPEGQEMLQISVADNGPGIPDAILDRIYAPFFSTKPKDKGTGLGLAICKRVVDMHKGRLDVETELGRGTTFRVLIPAHREKPSATDEREI